MIKVFYLIIIIGANGTPATQSSTPIGDKSDCLLAGMKVQDELPMRNIQFSCIEGVIK